MKLGELVPDDTRRELIKLERRVAFAMGQLTMKEYVHTRGESCFDDIMREFGWILASRSREMDWKGIDRIYKLGFAEVYVQIKSSNLGIKVSRGKTYEVWNWDVFKKKLRLPVRIYKEKNCFLGLVGLDVHEKNYAGTKLVIAGKRIKRFIEARKPIVGLIPGNKVIGHFKDKSSGTRSITKYKNSKSPAKWNEYFDRENMAELLLKEFKRQTRERESDEGSSAKI